MKLTTKFISTLIFFSFFLIGCSVQKASITEDSKAKQLNVPSGKAIVYIVRPSSFGFAVKFKVACDENYIGSTRGKLFIYKILEPGKHTFVSTSENRSEIELTIEPDKTYYIEQIPKLGILLSRNKLKLLTEGGKEKLNKCTLSADCIEKQ